MFERLKRYWKRDADLELELRGHLETEIDERMQAGAPAEEARYAARRAFGNRTLATEETRAVWGWPLVEALAQDVRYGVQTARPHSGLCSVRGRVARARHRRDHGDLHAVRRDRPQAPAREGTGPAGGAFLRDGGQPAKLISSLSAVRGDARWQPHDGGGFRDRKDAADQRERERSAGVGFEHLCDRRLLRHAWCPARAWTAIHEGRRPPWQRRRRAQPRLLATHDSGGTPRRSVRAS